MAKTKKPSPYAGLHLWDVTFRTGTYTDHTVTIVTPVQDVRLAIEQFNAWFDQSDWSEEIGASYDITSIKHQGTIAI